MAVSFMILKIPCNKKIAPYHIPFIGNQKSKFDALVNTVWPNCEGQCITACHYPFPS